MPDDVTNITPTNAEETVNEEVETQSAEGQEENYPEDYGEAVTFEDIINDPVYSQEYKKAVDKAVSKAIATYKKNHDVDVDTLVKQQVAEQVNRVRFDARLNEQLKDSGVIDTIAYKAHLDLEALRKGYDPEKNTIEGLDKIIADSKETISYLFKQDKPIATGASQGTFSSDKEPKTLAEALHMKYGK